MCLNLYKALARKKRHNIGDEDTGLKRELNLLDLTAFGVGSTLGLGVYVLAGKVAFDIAGPAVAISFIIGGVASVFAAICYAEFATRIPRAGSAYVFSYVGIGEFVAFSIGWDLALEYVIGIASLARGLSGYIDEMFGRKMSKALLATVPLNVPFLASYPDFFAFGIVMLLTMLLIYGMRESSNFNIVLTVINLLTITVVIIAGSLKSDIENWKIPEDKVPDGFGSGGFIPFGFQGIVTGAAKVFFGFIGFDSIVAVTEEAKKPKRDVPISIMLSIVISFIAYFGVSVVLTLMVPYYELNPMAPFPTAFEKVNYNIIKWLVSIAAIFAMLTSLLGSLYPLPRIMYAMGQDGLIFKSLSKVHNVKKTPIIATIVGGIFSGLMAVMFEVSQLVDMMSIGTLMAYTIVAICVLILRYREDNMEEPMDNSIMRQLFNVNGYKNPTPIASQIAKIAVIIFGLTCVVWCISSKFLNFLSTGGIIATCVCSIIALILLIIMGIQPATHMQMTFRTPCVPLTPAISVFFNLYLMFQLNAPTWIRYGIWMFIGYSIYYTYGLKNSAQKVLDEEKK